jgi:hypothetical protein
MCPSDLIILEHWQQRDREFETFLNGDSDLKFLWNRYLYVWDRNHRLLAWNDHIDKVHRGDLAWHYRVRSILLKTMDSITDALTSMHDINKATENSHVKSNLVHTLHRMQTVGKLDLIEFKGFLTHDEYEQAKAENAKAEKRTWYHIPRSRFLNYLHSVSLLTFMPYSIELQVQYVWAKIYVLLSARDRRG